MIMENLVNILLCIVINWLLVKAFVDESLLILTKSGPIQGFTTKTYSNKEIISFYGIPYAEPPVGNLRFRPPTHVVPWTETFQADKKPCPCHQHIDPIMEKQLTENNMMIMRPWCEDCLKLNIWVPKPAPSNSPVMVYFHGGAFILGSSVHLLAEGHTIAQEENVIVISINYRLGVFGFLTLPHPNTPGNVGLLDQQLALKWIRENIEGFGGDISKVTLFGVSAGGASVGYHLLSPGSRGLFQHAVLMSGVPLNPWAIREQDEIVQLSLKLAQSVNCQDVNVTKVIDCLQVLPSEEISKVVLHRRKFIPKDLFGPSVDGHFLIEHPEVSVEAGRFNDADVIIGTTSDEGAAFSKQLTKTQLLSDDDVTLTMNLFKHVLQRFLSRSNDYELEAIKNFYVDWSNLDDPNMFDERLSKMLGDMLFVCGTNTFADRFFKTGNKVFFYVFDQKIPPQSYDGFGAGHFSDAPFFSGAATSRLGKGAELSRTMMKLLGNFARTGDPNPINLKWPKYEKTGREYLNLAINMTVGANHRVQECVFWDRLVPMLQAKKDK